MKPVKGKSIETPIGRIIPGLGDRVNDKLKDGREINSSHLYMMVAHADASLTHGGKKLELSIGASFDAATVISVKGKGPGRMFKVDLQKLIKHAIEYGLLDPNLRFEEAK